MEDGLEAQRLGRYGGLRDTERTWSCEWWNRRESSGGQLAGIRARQGVEVKEMEHSEGPYALIWALGGSGIIRNNELWT